MLAHRISEAMSRPSMRFVSVKNVAQQGIQAMHRIRSGFVSHRTAKAYQIRAIPNYTLTAQVNNISVLDTSFAYP